MVVKIIKNWDDLNLMRQSPLNSGKWNDLTFILDENTPYDYLVVLNPPTTDLNVTCPKENCILLTQEPPVRANDWHQKSFQYFNKVLTQHPLVKKNKIIHTQTGLPWHIYKSYDELIDISREKIPNKLNEVSCIVSNKIKGKPSYEMRMNFIDFLKKENFQFALFGKKLNYIEDKFDGLASFKYSIAMENSCFPNYWTEKLADCFLSWTMPIYYGCPNILEYFPAESLIIIDLNFPEEALKKVKNAIDNNLWEKNLDAISKARNLILNKYQFFPLLTEKIKELEKNKISRKNFLKNIFKKKQHFIPRIYPD